MNDTHDRHSRLSIAPGPPNRAPMTPMPYPMAPSTPQTKPSKNAGRGNSDGVNDRQTKASATQAPGSV